jgi:hypothetical protein
MPLILLLLEGVRDVVIDAEVRHHPTPIDFLQDRPVVATLDRGDGPLRAKSPFRPTAFRLLCIVTHVSGPDRVSDGGAGGIRTLDRALQPYNGLANRRLQPLGHSSMGADMPDTGASRKPQIVEHLIQDRLAVPVSRVGCDLRAFCATSARNLPPKASCSPSLMLRVQEASVTFTARRRGAPEVVRSRVRRNSRCDAGEARAAKRLSSVPGGHTWGVWGTCSALMAFSPDEPDLPTPRFPTNRPDGFATLLRQPAAYLS